MRIQRYFQPFILTVLLASAAFGQSSSSKTAPVWFWFGDCRSAMTTVHIVIDGRTIHRSSFRTCRMERTDATMESEQKTRVVFHFSGGHSFQDTYRTAKNETIEGTIGQAGADPDAILLGVSFVAHDQILLNTVHVVKPGKLVKERLDRGVFIETYPMKSITH